MIMEVVARVRVLPGREADYERIFAERRRRVLATEPDTLEYTLFRNKSDPSAFIVIERFATEAAYHAHRAASVGHEAMLACHDGPPIIDYLDPVPDCV